MSPNFRLLLCAASSVSRSHNKFRWLEILAEKKFRKASGTTAEDEAKAPSVEVPDDFDDV